MDGPKHRIPEAVMWQMIGTAVLLDIISIIPAVQWVSDLGQALIFTFWFGIRGASFFSKKNYGMLKAEIVVIILEAIPIVGDVLPSITVMVIRNVLFVRKQDKKAIADYQEAMRQQEENQRLELQQKSTEYRQNSEQPSVIRRIGPSTGDVNRKAA